MIKLSDISPGSRLVIPGAVPTYVTVTDIMANKDGLLILFDLRTPQVRGNVEFTSGIVGLCHPAYETWSPGQHEEESE